MNAAHADLDRWLSDTLAASGVDLAVTDPTAVSKVASVMRRSGSPLDLHTAHVESA